jgi:hypothetical protein
MWIRNPRQVGVRAADCPGGQLLGVDPERHHEEGAPDAAVAGAS